MESRAWLPRLGLVLIIALSALVTGCSSKAYTKSRSELLANAPDVGVVMRPIEEDKKIFDEYESSNKARLRSLVEQRLAAQSHGPLYRIGANDEIEVHVFDVPELNFTARVTEGGFLAVPLVGSIKAEGSTQEELTTSLIKSLKEYVKDPRVTLSVVGFGSQRVAVLGAVKNPGIYPLKKGTTSLLEIVGEAGGLSPKAGNYLSLLPAEESGIGASGDVRDRARLALQSNGADLRKVGIEIALDDVLGTGGQVPQEVPLRGGDTVLVPDAGSVVVEGEVQRVGAFELGNKMTLLGALAAAGGITYAANVKEVEIVRQFNGHGKASLVRDLEDIALGSSSDVTLRSGDIVRVPTDTQRRISQDTIESISRVLNFGVGGHVNLGN
jgi:polysaccharide export outer membrane protein